MLVLSADEILARVQMPQLIESLRQAFGTISTVPQRTIVDLSSGASQRLLLLMPAFDPAGCGMVKLATVFPENRALGLPTIHAAIVALSPTGVPVALLDGTVITRLRTGAASALASQYLSRADSSRLVIIGTGSLAPMMAFAHCAVRPIAHVAVWGRRPDRALATVEAIRKLVGADVHVQPCHSLAKAVATADIVSCATSSPSAVLRGEWLAKGTFVDLVGSFSPAKRETDDEVVLRSRIFVDTFEGALSEAGDILDPLSRGIIVRNQIEGELADLVTGRVSARASVGEITLFKSVGTAIEDLAAVRLLLTPPQT